MEKLPSESKGVRNDSLQIIDRVNKILGALEAQAGAIATMTNAEHSRGADLEHLSNFFWDMSSQLHDAIELIEQLPLKNR